MGEISISGAHTALSETYLHPQLRVPSHGRPKHVSKYEIYVWGHCLPRSAFGSPCLILHPPLPLGGAGSGGASWTLCRRTERELYRSGVLNKGAVPRYNSALSGD